MSLTHHMESTANSDRNGSLAEFAEEESSAKLLNSSKNLQNATLSWEIARPKHSNEDNGKSSVQTALQRKSSHTAWDFHKESLPEGAEVMVYKRRWVVLFIFVFFAIVGTFQWSMYTIIANVITKYYKVSNLSVEFTQMSFLIIYVVAFFPGGWILNNLGLRWSMLIGCFLHSLGCFLRIFSVPSDRFWLTMIGQCIVGISQVFVTMIPTRLAAVWFPAHQVSFACAFAFNGVLVGNAIGFVVPSVLVRNSDNPEDVAEDLDRIYLILAAFALVSFILTVALFQEEPPLPPSIAQKLQRIRDAGQQSTQSPMEFLKSLKRLIKKRAYVILLVSFASIVGVFCAIATLLNRVLIPHFPGREKEVGITGLVLIVSGLVSSAICGYVLDRTHAFKTTTMVLYLLTLAGWIAFSVLLRSGEMFWIYASSAILGFATTGVQPVGLEFAVEITFPEPEGTASGLMCVAVQLFGTLCILLYGLMLDSCGDNVANAVMATPIVMGCIMIAFMRPRLKRKAAQQTAA